MSGKKKLKDLLQQSDNRTCADCNAPDPKWASPTIGVFLCLKCCGVYRTLGPNISKVLSVALDDWADEEIDAMVEVGGNSCANSIYEANVPEGVKPGPDASVEQRTKFIRSKYELQEFLKPGLKISSNNAPTKKTSFHARTSTSTTIQKPACVEGAIGHLKITILQGANLAVRDMLSSDPYVVVSLGEQKAQTTIQKSNLNPIWNEELMLSVPEDYGPVKLQVFDYDTFSADDIMGEAEIDIQPMLTSAMAYGDASQFGDMQIGKWLKSHDNALLEDSTVNIVDGKIKQEVSLQLRNVESGIIYLEVEWIPP
ncbi:ADP-ribosylation factor GTPase-activating protein AGD12-like [Rutidosis leptorrhynchoides]|uniref:ADP-ribosylation factor GTPase-activating protein AGD12-like n=1 Tax=Rutidosis leptorrhynchoides TaxID=125765 RepID=UPI003A9A0203